MNAARAYRSVQNETASKERLMVLLFERALEHIRTATKALDERKPREAVKPIAKATEIVIHLAATLDHKAAPALCKNLDRVYKFVIYRLTQAQARKVAPPLREAERVFAPIVSAFATAVAKIKP